MMDPANPASASLAAILENSVTRPQLGEWLESPTRDIAARLVHFASSPDGPGPASYSASPPYSRSVQSVRSSSSMAPAYIHQSNASTHPPSLHHSEATPTETSISTGLASRFSGVPLLEEVNGVLERRPNQYRAPVYECAFWFLSCTYISRDEEEWKTHCLSHFRGEEPPRSVQCPLCEFHTTCDDGWTAWNVRMDHIAYWHTMVGETLKTSRPDFHLFQHLWQKRLIDEQDLKELKGGNHNLTRPPTNYTVTNGRRERDGRRQRSQHVGGRRGW
ncbi:hypothetical protein BU26DRAFT_35536 [Trematosphaeria pertusa]|uniref:Uncharacterized protein n=1 Tax=Trematosphaeria pertusa TaxID=390896 RepID=A0A6A6J2X9_9PLEO|nr:uncharacterized protein BU26DRAFT_35536 [Trematosphaeria pertusa]KAF2257069.1 hypothetical protein BU26DRAFT_35536 [Trematosphaeria pertusa]